MNKFKKFFSNFLPAPASTFHEKISELIEQNKQLLYHFAKSQQEEDATQINPFSPAETLTRSEKILAFCNLDGLGLEIAPSFNPILPKSQGYRVETLDHLDKAGLIEKYTGHNVDLEKIEEPNYIWRGGSYVDAIGKKEYYDFIIASHIIEHTVDIIGFLNDCMKLLRSGGVLSLAIPDKRACFDYFRPISTIADAIDSHGGGTHSRGTVAEYILNGSNVDGKISWDLTTNTKNIKLTHNTSAVINLMRFAADNPNEYIDTHRWVFTRYSFELLLMDLMSLGFLKNMRILKSFDVEGCEFIIAIQKLTEETYVDINFDSNKRLDYLRRIENELLEVMLQNKHGR